MKNTLQENLTSVRPVDRVAAVVVLGNSILLMYRINHGKEYYTFPGGGIERGESKEEALVRECKEETSIDISVSKLLYELNWDNKTKQFFYLCDYIEGTPILGDYNEKKSMRDGTQFYDPKWFPITELKKILLYPLEIRDLLIHDIGSGFSDEKEDVYLSIETCRQTI